MELFREFENDLQFGNLEFYCTIDKPLYLKLLRQFYLFCWLLILFHYSFLTIITVMQLLDISKGIPEIPITLTQKVCVDVGWSFEI